MVSNLACPASKSLPHASWRLPMPSVRVCPSPLDSRANSSQAPALQPFLHKQAVTRGQKRCPDRQSQHFQHMPLTLHLRSWAVSTPGVCTLCRQADSSAICNEERGAAHSAHQQQGHCWGPGTQHHCSFCVPNDPSHSPTPVLTCGMSSLMHSTRLAEKMRAVAAQQVAVTQTLLRYGPISREEDVALMRGTSVTGSCRARMTCAIRRNLRVQTISNVDFQTCWRMVWCVGCWSGEVANRVVQQNWWTTGSCKAKMTVAIRRNLRVSEHNLGTRLSSCDG